MPRTVADRDRRRHSGFEWLGWAGLISGRGLFRFRSWSNPEWIPDELPNLDGVLWGDAPWIEQERSTVVDKVPTAALADWDIRIRCHVGGIWKGVRGGVPWQLVDSAGRRTKVVDQWGRDFSVPLPSTVNRLGDPGGTSGDLQWFGIDPTALLMWECSSLRPTPFGWRAHAVHVHDLSKPWLFEGSLAGGGLPIVAGVPRPEEFARGHIDHALWITLDEYAPEVTGFAAKTDGETPGHPLRAGEHLVLPADWEPEPGVDLTDDERTLIDAMSDPNRGLIVNDKTGDGTGNIRLPMDPRVLIDLEFMLTDFDVHTEETR